MQEAQWGDTSTTVWVSFNNFMEKYVLLFSLPSAAATASLGMSDWVILVSETKKQNGFEIFTYIYHKELGI